MLESINCKLANLNEIESYLIWLILLALATGIFQPYHKHWHDQAVKDPLLYLDVDYDISTSEEIN